MKTTTRLAILAGLAGFYFYAIAPIRIALKAGS